MNYRINRRVAGILAVSLLLLIAGCSGLGGGDAETAEPEPEPTAEPTEEMTEAETMDDGGTMTEAETMAEETEGGSSEQLNLPTYRFSEGESYTYEATFGDTTTVETWAVTSVDGDQVTVERETQADGETETQTVSGTHESIYDDVAADRQINFFLVARGATGFGMQGDLTPGNTFTVRNPGEDSEWDTGTAEVQRERTISGVSCTEYTVTPDGADQQWTICQAEGYPFAVALTLEQGGQTLLEMTLTDVTRP